MAESVWWFGVMGVRGQRSEVRGQRSEVRGQRDAVLGVYVVFVGFGLACCLGGERERREKEERERGQERERREERERGRREKGVRTI